MSKAGSHIPARVASAFLVGVSLIPAVGLASDWPSWRGPSQNGVSDETGLPSSWSPEGENLVWSDAWIGRSTPAVFDGRVCANGRTGEGISEKENVACWNAETGTKLWEHAFSLANTTVPFNRLGWGSVTGDPETGYLYVINVDGYLNCFDREGSIVWSWRLGEDLGRANGYGGRTSNPVIDENRLLLSIIGSGWGDRAGAPRHRYMALDKETGEILWFSTPGQAPADMNAQSVPIVAVIAGQRLIIDGGADGTVYALRARTGEKLWEFHLSKRAINSSPVVDGDTVYVGHSEENLDTSTMGRVVAIDGTGAGDVTATHEKWRIDSASVGFSTPTVNAGTLYAIDNSANLLAIDTESGTILWTHSVGTVGKASPVWADGKLYVTETNGNVHILEPSPSGVTVLDSDELSMPDGRFAEIYGSFAPAYGRLYFTAESGIYCLGNTASAFNTDPGTVPSLGVETPAGAITSIQVIPAEVIASSGDTLRFHVRAFDANGRPLGEREASWAVDGLAGATISSNGTLATSDQAANQGGKVVATVDGLTASAQVRVFAPLPWVENFESGRPSFWVGGGPRLTAVNQGGEQLLQKGPSPVGLHRHSVFLGPTAMSDYTIQADVMSTVQGRRRPDVGVINSGYTLDLQGNQQRIQLQSWAAELRVNERVAFAWEPNVWYTMKLRVDVEGDQGVVRGKIWRRNETEPTDWTVTAKDPYPVRNGSPGLIGYAPANIYFDNVNVLENQ